MRSKISYLLILLLILALTMQCVQEVDTETDIEANKILTQNVNKAYNAGDFETTLSYYVDNPIRMHQNEPILLSKEAIISSYQKNV